MREVKIPFRDDFAEVLRQGVKTMTTRTSKMGEPGDRFEAFGCAFQLVAVAKVPLWIVAQWFYKQEGCSGPNDFSRVWGEIHPIRGYEWDWKVWLHIFVNLEVL